MNKLIFIFLIDFGVCFNFIYVVIRLCPDAFTSQLYPVEFVVVVIFREEIISAGRFFS